MKEFALQGILLHAPYDRVFPYLSDPRTLPEWTNAFKRVSGGQALMQTPQGSVEVGLRVVSSRETGTVDWHMTFPGGIVERAFSRVMDLGGGSCLYSFMLTPPAAPLEQLEGTLHQQSRILADELMHLKQRVEQP
jgi:hypothetical protein